MAIPRTATNGKGEPKAEEAFDLPLQTEPMEAKSADKLPSGDWQFEPKWDGFRCLAFKAGNSVALRAKSGKPLGRYFPEIVAMLRDLPAERFVVDGELVIELEGRLAFDALQMRLHPAESRIRKLSAETPARLILFDMLVTPEGSVIIQQPLKMRRQALRVFIKDSGIPKRLVISPATTNRASAEKWLQASGHGNTDGVVAKKLAGVYESGERAMIKVKQLRTADCVVGGFRYESRGRQVGSLLLGLYNDEGKLDHVGFTATITNEERPALTKRLEALREPPGFTEGTGRSQPVEYRTQRRMGGATAGTRRRGKVRSCHRRSLPSRHETHALAPR